MNIALVITFKRQTLLTKLLDSILFQEQKFDKIYVVDNESSSETNNIINNISSSIIYLNPQQNLGCAGGFKFGLTEILKNHENGNVVFLDDDIVLKNDFLKIIFNSNELKNGNCVLPSKIYSDGSEFLWSPILKKNKLFVVRNSAYINLNNNDSIKIENITFEACVLPISVIRKIGLPNEDFFIDGDDFEYGLRILQSCEIFKLKNILVERQIKIPEVSKSINFLFFTYSSTRTIINPNRLYYEIRNKYLIGKTLKYSNIYVFICILPYYLKIILGQILFKELSIWKSLKIIYFANLHGFINKFGEKKLF